MFLYDVSVASYAVFKVARVCSIAKANRSISELIHLARLNLTHGLTQG